MLPVPELQETPKAHVGHTAKGTVEGIIPVQQETAQCHYIIIIIIIIITLYIKYNKNNNKYYNTPALSIVNQK